jgi:hypothetical protein
MSGKCPNGFSNMAARASLFAAPALLNARGFRSPQSDEKSD